MNNNTLWNIDQAAERLGISPYTVRAWVQQRRIPYIKVGRRVLFAPEDVLNFIESHKVPALEEK